MSNKKSIRSKGYAAKTKKSNGYTPQEKRTMIIGFAVIIVALICVLWVPDALEARYLLKVEDGVVQGIEDNELICNVGTSSNKKYRKLASVEPAEGYALASTEDGITDANLRYFRYEPTGEDAVAQSYTVQPGNGDASELVSNYQQQIGSYFEVLYQDEEITEQTINGYKTYSFVAEYRMEDTSEAESTTTEATAEPTAEPAEETTEATAEPTQGAAAGNVALAEEAEPTEAPTETPTDAPAEDATDAPEATDAPTDETDAAEATDEDADAVYDYTQSAIVYIESPIDGKCVVVNATNTAKDDSVFQDRAALLELAIKAAEGVTMSK